ncbi:hypothetical protein CHUAL_001977 [Chamberlinius hualienensis]
MSRRFPPKKRGGSTKVGGVPTDGNRRRFISVCPKKEEVLLEKEEEVERNLILRSRLKMLDNCWGEPMRATVQVKSLTSSPGSAAHPCPQCHKSFSSAGKLHQHLYVHTGERPFRCHECDKGFSSRFKLMRHALIHSSERRYKCSYCERCFHRKDHLKNHLQVHNPNKKVYKCEECLKEYNSRLSYRKHVAFHAAESGDLECKVCGKRFNSTEEILFHLKVHTGSRAVKSPNEKKFKCEFCERRFFTRKDVKRHLVVHTGRRDFLCQFCPQKFGRKDHLVRHIKKSHNNATTNVITTINNDIRHNNETFHFTQSSSSSPLAQCECMTSSVTNYLEEKQIKTEFLENTSSLVQPSPSSPTSMYLLSPISYPPSQQHQQSEAPPTPQLHELDGLEYVKMYEQVVKQEKGDDEVDIMNEEDSLEDQIDISQLFEFMPYTTSPAVINTTSMNTIITSPSPTNGVIASTSHITLTSHFMHGSVTPLPQFNQAFQ